MPASPAAIPATWVPWNEALRSSGSRPALPDPGPGYERATITFGVVYATWPRGKPAGKVYPAGSRKVLVWSIPSSTTAIFTPWPVSPVELENAVAPISAGLSSRLSVNRVLG